MRTSLLITTIGLALIGAGFSVAQDAPDPETIQRDLEERAIRIPARDLAAALSTRGAGAADRVQLIERAPDMTALRAALDAARAEDTRQSPASGEILSDAPPPPPRPGLRIIERARLANVDSAEVDRVFVPLLLPAEPSLRQRFSVYGMRNIYTATAAIDAFASLSISGTCNRVIGGDPAMVASRKRLAEGSPRLSGLGADYHISRNDFGAELSFSKFGCGYVMSVECNDPQSDARCNGDEYLTALADSMIIANPEIAEGEQ